MSEFVILHSNYFVNAGLVVSLFLVPVGILSVRPLKQRVTNQLYLKICGSVGLISFVGAALMGLGIYLDSLKNNPTEAVGNSFNGLLAVVICPGIFAVMASAIMAVSIWSYSIKQLVAQEGQDS